MDNPKAKDERESEIISHLRKEHSERGAFFVVKISVFCRVEFI